MIYPPHAAASFDKPRPERTRGAPGSVPDIKDGKPFKGLVDTLVKTRPIPARRVTFVHHGADVVSFLEERRKHEAEGRRYGGYIERATRL